MVSCASVSERNLLGDTERIVEKNKICKRKDDFCKKIVTDGLLALGYDASICKSLWEKSPSCPAGTFSVFPILLKISLQFCLFPVKTKEKKVLSVFKLVMQIFMSSNSSVMDGLNFNNYGNNNTVCFLISRRI